MWLYNTTKKDLSGFLKVHPEGELNRSPTHMGWGAIDNVEVDFWEGNGGGCFGQSATRGKARRREGFVWERLMGLVVGP